MPGEFGRRLQRATTARIKAYETVERDEDGRPTHVMLPSSNTLRAISEVLELPWPSTFTFAGYYHEILEALAALADARESGGFRRMALSSTGPLS